MPFKSKVRKRIYQREYMRRRRGSNTTAKSEAKPPESVSPNVRPKRQRDVRPRVRDDLFTDLGNGEGWWGWDESQA